MILGEKWKLRKIDPFFQPFISISLSDYEIISISSQEVQIEFPSPLIVVVSNEIASSI